MLSSREYSPYVFNFIPAEVGEELIFPFVEDVNGNVNVGDPLNFELTEMIGSNPIGRFLSPANESTDLMVGSTIPITIAANSLSGISSVEVYYGSVYHGYLSSLGYAVRQGDSSNYTLYFDTTGLPEALYDIAFVVRDYNGNQSGTFRQVRTTIPDRRNREIYVLPNSNQGSFTVKFTDDIPLSYKNSLTGSQRLDVKRGQVISLFIEASSSGTERISNVGLIGNGSPIINIDGTDFVSHDENSILNQSGVYLFQFIAQNNGKISLSPFVESETKMRVYGKNPLELNIKENYSQIPRVNLTNPLNEIAITSSSTIRLEANASDPDGSLEGVQFYVNGVVQDAWSGILDFNGTPPVDGQLLTIDDGTGKAAVTFEFDNDRQLSGGGTVSFSGTQGNQMDDMTVTGSYSGHLTNSYLIEIDGVGIPNTWCRTTFGKWSECFFYFHY